MNPTKALIRQNFNLNNSNGQFILWLAIALACLPHFIFLPIYVSVFCATLVAWQLFHISYAIRLPNNILLSVCTSAIMLILFISEPTMLGRDTGVAVLCISVCLKAIGPKSEKDVLLTASLGYFVIGTIFLFSTRLWLVMPAISSLFLFSHYLFIFFTSRQFGAESIISSVRFLSQALALTVLLSIVITSIPRPLWFNPLPSNTTQSGLSDTVSPGKFSQLAENDDIAFRAVFEKPTDSIEDLYWRTAVFTHYIDHTWKRSPSLPLKVLQETPWDASTNNAYSIYLEPNNHQWLPILDTAAGISTKFDNYVLQSEENEYINSGYQGRSLKYRVKQLKQHSPVDHIKPSKRKYISLPVKISPKARQLVDKFQRSINRDQQFDKAFVQLILQYFRTQDFYYTKSPPALANDPIDQFLFDSKQGYCEHFASSFVYLSRLAGIPARLVTGYLGGEMSRNNDHIVVRQSKAHAWAEVWIEDAGWTRQDPTSVIPESHIMAARQNSTVDDFLSRHFAVISQLSTHIEQYEFQWKKAMLTFKGNMLTDMFRKELVDALIIILSISILVTLVFRYYEHMRDQWTIDPTTYSYQIFCNKCRNIGLEKHAYEPASAFAKRIVTQRPDLKSGVETITDLYNRLRYTKNPSMKLLKQLKKAVSSLKP